MLIDHHLFRIYRNSKRFYSYAKKYTPQKPVYFIEISMKAITIYIIVTTLNGRDVVLI